MIHAHAVRSGVFISTCLMLSSQAMAELPVYRVQDLGTLGGKATHAADLNEFGQVTGYSETISGQIHAFLYSNGEMRDLGTLGGDGSMGNALNDSGQVTGFATTAAGRSRAFFYARGSMTAVGSAASDTIGNDISNRGHVAGYAIGKDGRTRAFAYGGGSVRDLAGSKDTDSFAAAVNDAGQTTGTFQDGKGSHAFLFSQGVRKDLFPGRVSSIFGSQALNNAGQVTGSFEDRGVTRAFLFENGRVRDLGNLGGDYSYGFGINSTGEVTGVSATAGGERHAFIYSGGALTDIGTLGGSVSFGYAINRSKQVAGESTLHSGGFHAFVYAGGRLVDLGLALDAQNGSRFIESVAYDINSAGQVVGRYYLPDAADPSRIRFRGFIATPIASLFDSLLVRVTGVGSGKSLANKVLQARRYYVAQNKAPACSTLKALNQELATQAGKKVPSRLAATLRKDVSDIGAAITCPKF